MRNYDPEAIILPRPIHVAIDKVTELKLGLHRMQCRLRDGIATYAEQITWIDHIVSQLSVQPVLCPVQSN
jgi:hypothetical protein